MAHSFRPALAALALIASTAAPLSSQPAVEHDDCEANFIAAVGADAYQFSPDHRGELGSVRLFSVLSYQDAAARGETGRAFWRLQIRSPRRLVYEERGVVPIADASGKALVEHYWNGRDDEWRRLPSGTYRYTFQARFVPDALGVTAARYEDLEEVAGVVEAFASTDEVILDHALTSQRAASLRNSAKVTSCQLQQHAPLEIGFGYNFYYGSTHAHSNFSDGGQPVANCTSGNAYGSGNYQPADVFGYARNVAGLDFWVINEHNHLIDDSVTTNLAPLSEAKVRQRYQNGRNAAAAATVDDAFVAVYGMEWGVLTNPDQGHVTLLETPVLFGWESCTNCNGPSAECTPGSNCYFDVFTPKRFGYLTLYQRSVQNPSSAGALGILAHPSSGQFDNFAFNADADAALQGIAVRSGLAFSTAENCADANVANTDYSPMWRDALNRGFHLGPTADHDSHCVNYGQGIPTRTVYLIPNGASPVLTKAKLLQAHKARHFFASEDPNAQLVFATSDGAHVMGDVFAASSSIGLRGAVYDPNGDAVQTIELWRGQIGGGVQTVPYRSFGASSFSLTESPGTGTWYYFVHAVQADGHDLWSAPMWITFGGGGGGGSLAIGGWTLTQANSAGSYTVPAGTTIPAEGYVVIGRSATKAAFEAFWGVTLGSNVVYLDSAGVMPVINGDENYTLRNAGGSIIDGATINMAAAALQSVRRSNPCGAAGSAGSWTVGATTTANAGSGAAAGCGIGVVVNEFADATGTGNFVYEFVELHYDSAGGGDTQAPATAITAPSSGATVSGTVSVTAPASDNVGVTRVEFFLDGALQSTDTASPYAWSWNTAAASNGAHSLTSKAYDAAGNVGTSAAVPVTVSNGTDVGGWRISQANATLDYTIPAGTVIPNHGYLVVARNATKAAFEAFWGVTLGSSVVYLSSADTMPQINGSETYSLYNAASTKVEGPTFGMASAAGQSLRRIDPCNSVGVSASWNVGATTLATPGSGAGAGCAGGVKINEFSDAVGTGNFVYEFVELHNDR
jgi:hypothetical protein